ncbi:MAG: thioredoxin family protein [Thermoleophilia bacterium]
MEIKVLGSGCKKCNELYEATKLAVERSGVEARLMKVEDIEDILAHGVMLTPALVIDGDVKSTGKVPDQGEIVSWITTAAHGADG